VTIEPFLALGIDKPVKMYKYKLVLENISFATRNSIRTQNNHKTSKNSSEKSIKHPFILQVHCFLAICPGAAD
jgi:hypothetical protein